MRKVLLLVAWVLVLSSICYSKDVYIEGYYRKDGTYVRPHYRSSPDKYKWNNYGPSKSDRELLNPNLRDNDKDGIPNRYDIDDDNDSIYDDYDPNQYSPKSKSLYQNERPFKNRLKDYQYFQEDYKDNDNKNDDDDDDDNSYDNNWNYFNQYDDED